MSPRPARRPNAWPGPKCRCDGAGGEPVMNRMRSSGGGDPGGGEDECGHVFSFRAVSRYIVTHRDTVHCVSDHRGAASATSSRLRRRRRRAGRRAAHGLSAPACAADRSAGPPSDRTRGEQRAARAPYEPTGTKAAPTDAPRRARRARPGSRSRRRSRPSSRTRRRSRAARSGRPRAGTPAGPGSPTPEARHQQQERGSAERQKDGASPSATARAPSATAAAPSRSVVRLPQPRASTSTSWLPAIVDRATPAVTRPATQIASLSSRSSRYGCDA